MEPSDQGFLLAMDLPALYGDNSPYHVAQVANRLPSNESTESTNFILDPTTPHGDVIINESCAIKPAVGWVTVHATEPISGGVHEWSIKVESQGETSDGSGLMLGIVPKSFNRYDSFISQGGGWCISRAGKFYGNWKRVDSNTASGISLVFGTGDTVVFELDFDSARLTVSVGDRYVIGELSNLTADVYPAISLHYKLQHVCFESRRTKERHRLKQSWYDRYQLSGADVYFRLSADHSRALVRAAVAQGGERLPPLETTPFATLFKARSAILHCIYSSVGHLLDTEMLAVEQYLTATPAMLREQLRCRYMPVVYATALDRQVSDASLHCGLQLFFSLVSSMTLMSPALVDKMLASVEEMLGTLPLFSLSETSACRPAHLTESVLDDLHGFLRQLVGDLVVGGPTPARTKALHLLLTLALGRGALRHILEVVQLLLLAGSTPAWQAVAIPAQPLLAQLGQFRNFADLTPVVFSEDTGKWDLKALPAPQKEKEDGAEDKDSRVVVLCLATDGRFVYLNTTGGFMKVGTGYHNTSLKVYACNPHFPYKSVTEHHTLACTDGQLWFRSTEFVQVPKLCLLVVSPATLQILGDVKVDGTGTVPSGDLSQSPLAFPPAQKRLPSLPPLTPLGPEDAAPEAQSSSSSSAASPTAGPSPSAAPQDALLSDGRFLYLLTAREFVPRASRRDRAPLPSHPTQLRPDSLSVTVHKFDPQQQFQCLQSTTLSNPRAPAHSAKFFVRQCVAFAKDSSIDLGDPEPVLSIPSGFVTVEAWVKVLNKEEARVIYSHGLKNSGGEVFIEIHPLENGYYWKVGCRQDQRQGMKSSSAVFTVSQSYVRVWLHVAVVFDGRWRLYLNGNPVAASKRDEPQVYVDSPKKRWCLGSNFIGMICEVRVWKGHRSTLDIQRDMNRTLTGKEPGLAAYYKVNEGYGHAVYDWCGDSNGWITRSVHPSWRLCDVPIITSAQDAVVPASQAIDRTDCWPVFLPSVKDAFAYTNGVELGVVVPKVDDTIVSGKVYGVLNFYSLETGRLLEKEVLTSPYIDGSVCYDRDNNLIWFASNSAQSLCWLKNLYATPTQPVEGQRLHPETILSLPAFAVPDDPAAAVPLVTAGVRVLASCDLLGRSFVQHADTLYLYKDMYLDAHQTTFALLHDLLGRFYSRSARAFARPPPAGPDLPHYVVCACLRLLRVNLDVFAQAKLHPDTVGLQAGVEGLGMRLFGLLESLANDPHEAHVKEVLHAELSALLAVSLTVFFPSTATKVCMLAELLTVEGVSTPFRSDLLLRALLQDFGGLALSLALIRLCLPHTPEFQGATSPPDLLPVSAPTHVGALPHPPSLLGLLDALLHRSQQQLLAALAGPANGSASAAPLPFVGVLSAVQSALLTLAGHRPGDAASPLFLSVLFRYTQRLIARTIDVLLGAAARGPDGAAVGHLQTSFVGTLVPPLLNSLLATDTEAGYLAELQRLIDAVAGVLVTFPDAVESERLYAEGRASPLAPATAGPPTPPAAAPAGGLSLAALAPGQMCALHWLHDLKFSAQYLAASIACRMVGAYEPPKDEEDPEHMWLDSQLFAAGLRDPPAGEDAGPEAGGGKAVPALVTSYSAARPPAPGGPAPPASEGQQGLHVRLRQPGAGIAGFTHQDDQLCDLLALGEGDGAVLWEAVKREAKVDADVGGPLVQAALRHILAAFLKHSQTPLGAFLSDEKGVRVAYPDRQLVAKYHRVEALRPWLIELRDRDSTGLADDAAVGLAPATLAEAIERCRFALQFVPSACGSENRQVLKCILATTNLKKKAANANSWKKMFHGWRVMKKLQRLLQLNMAKLGARTDTTLELLLQFLRDPKVSLPSFHSRLLQRRERGRLRCQGLDYLKRMLASPVPRKELLLLLGEALVGHHYSDGIQACGADITYIVQSSVFAVFRELFGYLGPAPGPAKDAPPLLRPPGKGKDGPAGTAPVTAVAAVAPQRMQDECRFLTIKLLMMNWKDYDFAFFRSINLPVLLFNLCSAFDQNGAEKPESEAARTRRKRLQDKGSTKPRPAKRDAPDALPEAADALQERAWLAVRMLTISCGLAMGSGSLPGVLKACGSFMVQVFECIARELRQTLAVLNQSPTPAYGRDRLASESWGASRKDSEDNAASLSQSQAVGAAGGGGSRATDHCAQLLSLVGVVLQHPNPQLLDCICHTNLLAILFTCVVLPHCPRIAQLATIILGRVVLDLPPDVVDAAVAPCRRPPPPPEAPGDRNGGLPADCGIDEAVPGGKTIRFLVDVAGAVVPTSSTQPFTSELANPALRILRAMHLHPGPGCPWRDVVNGFVAAHLARFPAVGRSAALYHDPIRYFCVALHILTGCPDTLHIGSEATFTAPNGVAERLIVLQCDYGKGRAVCISAEDVSVASEEREVPIEQLGMVPREDADAVNEAFFEPFLGALKALQALLQPEPLYVEDKYLCLFGATPQQSLVLSYIAARLLCGLPMFLRRAACCERLVTADPALLQNTLRLCAVKSRSTWSLPQLEEMAVLLHQHLCSAVEPAALGDLQDADSVASPTAGGPSAAPPEEDPARAQRQEEALQVRRVVAAQLTEILGYSFQCCVKALEMAKDDKETAASLIMDSPEQVWHAMEVDRLQEARSKKDAPRKPRRGLPVDGELAGLPFGLQFNGPDGFVDVAVPRATELISACQAFSVELVFRLAADQLLGAGILFWYGIPGVAYVTLALEAGQVVLSCTAQGMSLGCRGTISRDQGAQWHHVVLTVDRQHLSLYCNGRATDRQSLHCLPDGVLFSAGRLTRCHLGISPAVLEGSQHGALENIVLGYVKVWTEVATPTQATQLYLNHQAEVSGARRSIVALPPTVTLPNHRLSRLLDSPHQEMAVDGLGEDDPLSGRAYQLAASRLVIELLLQEGTGSELQNGAEAEADRRGAITLHGNVEWVCCDMGPWTPEDDFKALTDAEEEKEAEGDEGVCRADWHTDWKALEYLQLRQLCIEVFAATAIVGARLGVLALLQVATQAASCPVTAAQYPRLRLPELAYDGSTVAQALVNVAQTKSNTIAPEDIAVLQQFALAYFNADAASPNTQRGLAAEFVQDCLALLREPFDYYEYATPHHPYRQAPPLVQQINVPGANTYHVAFDSRCKTLDYLHFYTDRSQKLPINKFPDSKGQWHPFTVRRPFFYVKFSSENANPSYWGYRFIVSVRSVASEVALELLEAVLCAEPPPDPAVLNHFVFAHLAAAAHQETGAKRRKLLGILTAMLAPHRAALYPRYCRPHLGGMQPLRQLMVQQYLKEQSQGVAQSQDARCYSRFLQSLAELSVAVHYAQQAWRADARGPADLELYEHSHARRVDSEDGGIRLEKLTESDAIIVKDRGSVRGKGKFLAWSDRSWQSIRSTVRVRRGRWYYEARVHGTGVVHVGWCSKKFRPSERAGVGDCAHSWAYDGNRLGRWHRGQRQEYGTQSKWKNKDIVGCLLDMDSGIMAFMHNGVHQGVAFGDLDTSQWLYPAASFGSPKEGGGCEFNFGAAQFVYDPPPGFQPLDPAFFRLPPLFPFPRLFAWVDCCRALLQSNPLPPYCSEATDLFPDKSVRDGPQLVELVALDGRPRIEGMEVSAPAFASVRANAKVKGGKWYYEVLLRSDAFLQVGWCSDQFAPDAARSRGLGDDEHSWAFDGCRLLLRWNKAQRPWGKKPWKDTDVVGCLLNLDEGEMQFSVNGKLVKDSEGDPVAFRDFQEFIGDGLYPALSFDQENGCLCNFGATELLFKPPDYQSIGIPSPLLQSIEAFYATHAAAPGAEGEDVATSSSAVVPAPTSPPAPPAPGSAFARDVRIVQYAARLCELQRKAIQAVAVVGTPKLLAEFGLQPMPLESLTWRVGQLRQFNAVFRMVHGFLNPMDAPQAQAGPLTSLVAAAKPLLFPSVVQEVLRAALLLSNRVGEHVKVTVNRRKATRHKLDPSKDPSCKGSLFGQVHSLLGAKGPGFFRSSKRLWAVVFAGEGADDVGGPYRELLAGMCAELMSPALPLFLPSPNHRHNVGEHRDRYVLHPGATTPLHLSMLTFLGRLIGGCIRGGEPLPLCLTSVVWKMVVGDRPTVADLESIDKTLVQSMRFFSSLDQQGVTEELFSDYLEANFTTVLSDGTEVELVPGGRDVLVTFQNRHRYVDLVLQRRLHESDVQLAALVQGIHSVVPLHALSLLTWQHLEVLVCGRPDFDLDELKALVRYEGLSPTDVRVQYLWQVLAEFTPHEKALFMRFISGRERLPVRLKVMPLHTKDDPDNYLPGASTCFFWISLPNYSSAAVMRQKLLYAVQNCADIDADFRARDFDDDAPPTVGVAEGNDDDEFEDYSHLL